MGGIFIKQKIMRRVVASIVPLIAFSMVLYGWRSPILIAVSCIFGILTEYVVEKTRGKKVSEAVLVTCLLYGLSLPPATPLWIAAVGIIFGVLFGKELFGGFGRNIFNPAIVGRLFIYITFPTKLATAWVAPQLLSFGNPFGGGVDAITAATPLAYINAGTIGQLPDIAGSLFGRSMSPLLNLFLGFRAGSLGESSIILIVLAAIYLMWTKTAQWRLIVSTLATEIVLITLLYVSGVAENFVPLIALCSGSLFYVAVFMCTDPVSAPNKPLAQLLYGAIIGTCAVLIRTFSGFPEGTSFAVMIGNVFASLLDEITPKKKKKVKKVAAPA